jgi:hypothetical protein
MSKIDWSASGLAPFAPSYLNVSRPEESRYAQAFAASKSCASKEQAEVDTNPSAPVRQSPGIEIIDNPHAPDAFATDAVGYSLVAGNVGVTFVTTRLDHSVSPAQATGVVIGRLVMPVDGAQRLATGLLEFLKQRGLAPIGAEGER